MALTKETVVDKIEVVTDYKIVQVRYAEVVKEDGKIISSAYKREVLHPDEDVSSKNDDVKAVCNAVWTDAVKTAWANRPTPSF